MKGKKVYRAICIIVFVCLFLVIFHQVTYVVRYKVHENDTIGSFYKEEKNTIDVLVVGSSHVYRGFSPMVAWNETGITSYSLASASQSIPNSYYLIKEGIRTQHPQVVALEIYGARYESNYVSNERLHTAMDGIPLNSTKIELVRDLLPSDMDFRDKLEYLFPVITYHTRWTSLVEKDFQPLNQFLRGFVLNYKSEKVEEPPVVEESEPVYENTLVYLDKIIELCKQENVELILFQTPSGNSGKYAEVHQKTNRLKEYASEQGISCVDYELLRDELDLDYSKDFKDSTHLNAYGAEKLTKHFAEYLVEHYDLENHKGEEGYEKWDEDYQAYQELAEERKSNVEDQEDNLDE